MTTSGVARAATPEARPAVIAAERLPDTRSWLEIRGELPPTHVDFDARSAELLRVLRHCGGTTRAQLMDRMGWTRPTVGQHLEPLLRSGLVVAAGQIDSTGGRPAVRLAFNGSAGVVLAACVADARSHVAIVDLAGRVLAEDFLTHALADGPVNTLDWLVLQWDALLARTDLPTSAIWGVGVGLPGPVDGVSGRPINSPMTPGWEEFPVAEWLRARIACPVVVENDANVMALGERDTFWPDADQLVFVKADTAMSAGLIVDGSLYRGAHGLAGDIGHIHVPGRDDAVCACGNTGCMEAVVGGRAIASRLTREGLPTADARQVTEHVRAGEPRAILAVRESGRQLGHGLAGLVNAFNPGVLVIGGPLAGAGDHLLTGIREVVYRHAPAPATSALTIVRASADDCLGVIGAAALATDLVLPGPRRSFAAPLSRG